MEEPNWGEDTLKQLRALFAADDRIISLGVFGSMATPEILKDQWSDIDLFVVVADDSFDSFHESLEWVTKLGESFAVTRNASNYQASIKVIFTDFRKMDIVVATVSAVNRRVVQSPDQQLLFSKDAGISDRIRNPGAQRSPGTPRPHAPPEAPPREMIEEFWFLAFTSVTKLMRNDLLIALHLALELQRMNLVLGMMLRDREMGTNVHRTGGVRNDLVARLNFHLNVTTRRDILTLVERSGQVFDELAKDLNPDYRERSAVFRSVIERARDDLVAFAEW